MFCFNWEIKKNIKLLTGIFVAKESGLLEFLYSILKILYQKKHIC
ncbi:hypothetical protein CAXC1_180054 [Candidatus Xenohaliotis californiensis]|uniref:Uncharacterized protein n=1 Tax=Candidatus Xenohaliotis californiensis TaxID=84677 RepID=A0ABP0ETH3_9RICK|nr:hypothetical protein CAXC1_180054 [Candidatus Xenohaliotis californiensis]